MPVSSAVSLAPCVRASLVAATACIVAACASYHARPIDPAAESNAFEARRIAVASPGGVDLAALTEAALRFQPEVEAAAAARKVAEAAVTTAGGRLNPTLSVSAQKNRDAPPGTSPWTNGFSVGVPVETAGKRDFRIGQALLRVRAAALREEDVRLLVRGRVRDALIGAYRREKLAQTRLDIQQDLTAAIERRQQAGLVSRPEVLQARLALGEATRALEEARRQQAEGIARLAAAVGVPARALEGLPLSFEGLTVPRQAEEPADATTQREALLRRPDVLAALADYEASQSAPQLEIAKQYPDVSVGPGYTWDAGAVKWSLALALALPVLNRNEGPIAEAEARRDEAAAAFRSVQAKAVAEVDEALAGYRQTARQFETAERILADARQRERSANAALRAGEEDHLSFLAARLETTAAETARTDALLEAWRAAGRLEDALRKPLADNRMRQTTGKQP